MLVKLLAYNLQHLIKPILICAGLTALTALIFYFTQYDTEFITHDTWTEEIIHASPFIVFVHGLFYNLYAICGVVLTVITLIRIWSLFQKNLYSDEAYLTYTLPIKRHIIWASHCLAALIAIIICMTTILLSNLCFNQDFISAPFQFGADHEPLLNTISYFCLILQLSFIAVCGFLGIILGHRHTKQTELFSRLWGFIVFTLGEALLLLTIFLFTKLNPAMQEIFQQARPSIECLQSLITLVAIVYAIYLLILYPVCQKLLDSADLN